MVAFPTRTWGWGECWGRAAQKDKGFIIKRQHFGPSSLHETSPSGLHLINMSPTYREQNAIPPEISSADRNGGGNPTILLWRARG